MFKAKPDYAVKNGEKLFGFLKWIFIKSLADSIFCLVYLQTLSVQRSGKL